MSGHSEEKITKLLSFPYDNFLMVRFEFVQILGDELEAKVLRIIEKTVEAERKRIYRDTLNQGGMRVPQSPLDITRDVWVPISYKMFMSDLYGTVTSETTIKRALKSLLDKRIIFRQHQQRAHYDAPEYKVHVSVLQMLLDVLRNPEGQKLIPSILEALSQLPPQELTPAECQKLIPSQAGRGSEVDTIYNNEKKKNYNKRENPPTSTASPPCDAAHADIAALALDFSSLLASIATLTDEQKQQLRGALLEQPSAQPPENFPIAIDPPSATVEGAEPVEKGQPEGEGQDERSAPPPKTRSKPTKDTPLAQRIESVFLCLDKLAQRTTGDPDFTWTRSERAKRSVQQLLAGGRVVTEEKLSAVYLHMATMKPDPKTGFTWANKMSVANVCNNYDSIWLEIVRARQHPKGASSASSSAIDTSPGSPGATPLRTLVVYGSSDHELPSHPLPVAPLRRDPSRRCLAEKGA